MALCASLNTAAQDFSSVLAAWGTMSHVGPDGSTLYTRVAAAGYVGYTSVSENVAAGQLDAATVMGSWMASSGHRANILYPTFTQVGAGRSDALVDGVTVPYWVLDLGVGGSC
ncbi:MAG: CAP domain-containing protein [Ilumatobacteraceae bacterium]